MPALTYYFVAWISTTYACPWGLSHASKSLQDALCARQQEIKISNPYPRLNDALSALRAMNTEQGLKIWQVQGTRKTELQITWKPQVEG